jgi:acetylornithine deacetylase/succinyl-diaminopimelate desuccinylase-like protein
MSETESALKYARANQQSFLDDFKSLLRVPSISTLPEHKEDIKAAATWIAERLRSMNFEAVEIIPTAKHPVVYGEHLKAGPDAPTLLFYAHYDVQPTDPLDKWDSDPFEPTIRNDDLYARGASDMKGQLVAHLKALESMVKTTGLPINLKYMVEGEEEIGSPNLGKFIDDHRQRLQCDLCLNSDSGILAPDTPAITFSLRGLAYFELRLQGAENDLHSGQFGGVVDNPGNVLCDLIAGMRRKDGHILLPGFYDDVREMTEEDRKAATELPEEWWLEQSSARKLFGEPAYSPAERATARPTLDVNGLLCGFTGEGSKTVLPAKAMAKISMRLVPDQHPSKIKDLLEAYLRDRMPETMDWELKDLASSPPAIVERDSDAVRAASRALHAVWGEDPVFLRQGGTVPVVGLIQEKLGVDSLMLGFGLPDDNLHAPNEKQHLPNFYRGIETYVRFSHEMARIQGGAAS